MKIWPESLARWQFGVAIASSLLIAALVQEVSQRPVASISAGLLCGAAYYLISMRKYYDRKTLLKQNLREESRRMIDRSVAFFGKLDGPNRQRFEDDLMIFLSEQRIHGVRGTEVRGEIKLLIAAAAATLGHGIPNWEWPVQRDIVVYPTAFTEQYDIDARANLAGMVHQQGPIIFSERDLLRSYNRQRDGYNVALHEFAHVLDIAAGGGANGFPVNIPSTLQSAWNSISEDRYTQIRDGNYNPLIRDYAGLNRAEFFAVTVEVFFEKPLDLQRTDPQLYELFAEYFNIDPFTATLRKPVFQ